MDLQRIEEMNREDLQKYTEFLLWHYRVMDAFWFINVGETFDQPTAERINEKVWRRVSGMASKDLLNRFQIKEKGLTGFVKARNFSPGAFSWAIISKKSLVKFLLPFPLVPLRKHGCVVVWMSLCARKCIAVSLKDLPRNRPRDHGGMPIRPA